MVKQKGAKMFCYNINNYIDILFYSYDIESFKEEVLKAVKDNVYSENQELFVVRAKDCPTITFYTIEGMEKFAEDFYNIDKNLSNKIKKKISVIKEKYIAEEEKANAEIKEVETIYNKYKNMPINQLIEMYISLKDRNRVEKEILGKFLKEKDVLVCMLTEPVIIGTKTEIKNIIQCKEEELKNRDAFIPLCSFHEKIQQYQLIGG